MKIIKNEKLIKRNGKIGQFTSFGALGVLGVGMYMAFQRPDLFAISIGALVIGFALTQIGMFFTNRWGRNPRPDEQLDAALKGIPSDTSIYHYEAPVPHLLVGPAGVWILRTYQQRGRISFYKNRWRISGGGFMQSYMTIFGQEGLGRPDLEIANDIDTVRKFFAKHMEEAEIPAIQGALIFTNDQLEIDNTDLPLPAMKLKQLKEFIRQKSKDRSVGSLALDSIKALLPEET